MRKLLIITALTFVIFINIGCPTKSCVEANYSFAFQSQIIPDRDSINIGDTIYLISSFPTKLKDQNTSIEINYSEANNLGSTLGVGELINGDSFPKDAIFNFSYISVKGRIYNDRNVASPDGVQQLVYEELNGNYELKVGLITLKKGIYVLGIGDGLGIGRRACEKASFFISLGNTSQHIYFYQNWRPGYILTESDLKHIYCFKVY
jgi:hypothetical protein